MFAVVFAVSAPLIEACLKFEQIVRDRIHRIPPKVRSGIDGNNRRDGDHKSRTIAESGDCGARIVDTVNGPLTKGHGVLRGNLHGAFLGGGVAVMLPCYPAITIELISIDNITVRVTGQTSAWSFGAKHFDDDATNRNSSRT